MATRAVRPTGGPRTRTPHRELRARLLADDGVVLRSETDTELVAHLIHRQLAAHPKLEDAVRAALAEVEGAYALVVVSETEPDRLIAAKTSSPLVVGLGDGETFLASDVPAILEHTREVIFLEDGDLAEVTAAGVTVRDLAGKTIERAVRHVTWSPAAAEKGGYKQFMLKEIHEQPRALADTIAGRVSVSRGESRSTPA